MYDACTISIGLFCTCRSHHLSQPLSDDTDFTIGIEEEYLLVDCETGELATDPPKDLMLACSRELGSRVSPELMQSQVEVGTNVCGSVVEARSELAELRRTIAEITAHYGLAPIAASTHPFARWLDQKQTEKARYAELTQEMQGAARRLLICGMHVHVGIARSDLRIDVMNQLTYFLPHMLALSASSPFWEGANTGLKSYRLTVFDGLPRTGLPPQFSSYAEYERQTGLLQSTGVIADGSSIWWDLRPSARFPTLETRIMDVCTSLDHAVSMAALIQCLVRFLFRTRRGNMRWRVYDNSLISENRWRAMRYGTDEGMIDFGRGQITAFGELVEELIELLSEDASALGCSSALTGLRTIMVQGTSAHRQLHIYGRALAEGQSREQALRNVVKWLVEETTAGLD